MDNENKKDLLPEEAPETPIPEETVVDTQDSAENNPQLQEAMEALEAFSGLHKAPDAEETPAQENLPDSELTNDTEFQDALKALQNISAFYVSSEAEVPAEIPAEKETTPETPTNEAQIEDAPTPEETQMYVSEDTVSFTAPVTADASDMSATQKFTPVSNSEKNKNTATKKPRRRAPVRKGRPAPKKGYGLFGIPHVISTFIWLAIIVTIGISLGRTIWVCAADLLAFGKPDKVITITIEETDTTKDIAKKLEEAGLIRYPNLFVFFADITGKGDRVIPDTYNLNAMYDYNALLKMMSYQPANTSVVEIMIPEGSNCAQIFKLLEEKGVCSVADLEEWAANGELKDYWFLEGLPRGTKYCLEGYLYPDTYKFYMDAEPQYVLQKFLNNFENRFTEKMYNDFLKMQERYAKMLKSNGYSQSWIDSHKLTFHQLITVASIVEEEKATSAEGYDIAAVFYNRLTKATHYPRLDSDATVYYAIGSYFERKPLTQEDLNNPSPYNTRKSNGLPPGPITNPGSYSLYAALYPSEAKYYYFIFDKTAGIHRFSKTLAEHNKWAEQLG